MGLYVTLFAIGHSLTLLLGVLGEIHVSPYAVDAIIGLSVVYKALDNLGAFRSWFGVQPDNRVAVLLFGLCHGFGLATKLQELVLPQDGLVTNILAFNLGVEAGQLLALAGILLVMSWWRSTPAFMQQALAANLLLLFAGFLLTGYQLAGYFLAS
ncbi:MAG: HupE/UreJ family protein [Thiolinea sp.]